MRGLKNKTALITGGLGDLGWASALRLAEEGCRVLIWDTKDASAFRQEINKTGMICYTVDVTNKEAIAESVKEINTTTDRIDVLINAATRFLFKGVNATREDWNEILSVNIIGSSLVTEAIVKFMKLRRSGSIINFSSVSGFIGQSEFATYNTTKFAIRGLTKCWAKDLAPYNIRVNTVCPGYIYTSAFEKSCHDLGLNIVEENKRAAAMHLLNRQGQPQEIAAAVAFLASDDASFITGSDLIVDGGYLAQ